LDLIIPHQANQRIIDGLGKRLGRMDGSIYSNIAKIGNTSSNSIPVALAEVFEEEKPNGKVALCAFGGGFTYGAALIEI
jgi:3-oxoacyl-[acyl-carrier-protein] synthase III